MHRVLKVGAALGALLSCSYDPELVDTTEVVLHEIDAVRVMEPQGPAFNQGLRQGYLDYSDVMTSEYDRSDYWHFAFKAVDSAKGEAVPPDPVELRDLQSDNVEELSAARARLMAALDQTGRKKAPWQAAKAQTAFDCWLERAEENDPPEQIEVCKGEFELAMTDVERALTTEAGSYLVFFAWDQAELTPVAMAVLDQVQADYLRARPALLTVAGHADRSGAEFLQRRALGAPGGQRRPSPLTTRRAGAGARGRSLRRAQAAHPYPGRPTGAAQPAGRDHFRLIGKPASLLTPGYAHMTPDGRLPVPPVDHEVMTLGLAGDPLQDRLLQEVVALGGP